MFESKQELRAIIMKQVELIDVLEKTVAVMRDNESLREQIEQAQRDIINIYKGILIAQGLDIPESD